MAYVMFVYVSLWASKDFMMRFQELAKKDGNPENEEEADKKEDEDEIEEEEYAEEDIEEVG